MRSIWALFAMVAIGQIAILRLAGARTPQRADSYTLTPIPKTSPDYDPDEVKPDAKTLAKLRVPSVTINQSTQMAEFKLSPDHRWLTCKFGVGLRNDSCRQIAEVDIVCAMVTYDPQHPDAPRKEVWRTKPAAFKSFENVNVFHQGTLEPFAILNKFETADYTVPADLWRTDSTFEMKITRVVPVADERDKHDIGNMIEFIAMHHTADVEKAILKDPSLIHAYDSVGTTTTLVAFTYGTPRLMRFIIAHGGDIHARNINGDGAMVYAASGNNTKMLDFALSKGFSVDPEPTIPLKRATVLDKVAAIKWLIAHGAKINRPDPVGYTPLAISIMFGNMDAFDVLVAAKADVHCKTNNGMGLMHFAIRRQNFLPKVLALGVSVEDPIAKSGQTALMTAAMEGYYDSAKWLLDHGANLKAKDSLGRTVFDFARASNGEHTDRYLRDKLGDLKKYGGE